MSETTSPLTVVLVHGAFADASSWNGVIERLQGENLRVMAPPNPLRGPSIDSEYIASFLSQISGPVLLVGHSYGGAVITNAGSRAPNVKGLVYVCAFAPEEGEMLQDVAARSRDSILFSALMPMRYPTGSNGETEIEFAIDPVKIHDAFCADLSPHEAAVIAATQRPLSALSFTEVNGPAAWKTLPSWAAVGMQDRAVGTDNALMMARRAGAAITEIQGSHVIMMSKPDAVADVILEAVSALASGNVERRAA